MLAKNWSWVLGLSAAAVLLLVLAPWGDLATGSGQLVAPDYGETFWNWWGDGKAELAGYELTYSRYGSQRRGTAVAIFVTETFAAEPRVKHEDPRRGRSDTFPVIKLNLIQDFPTGIYDYNLMSSTFVALEQANGRPPGSATKVAFSSQEWCGQAYAQLLFDEAAVRFESHSYFDGEADERRQLDYPPNGISEDALLLWARGLASPVLEPGGRRKIALLRSLELARLRHVSPAWESVELRRAERPTPMTVPAGDFEVYRLEAVIAASTTSRTYPPGRGSEALPERTWTFYVEREPPHRIVKWERSDGMSAVLLAESRLEYWAMNGPGFERELRKLGLSPRPPRSP